MLDYDIPAQLRWEIYMKASFCMVLWVVLLSKRVMKNLEDRGEVKVKSYTYKKTASQ